MIRKRKREDSDDEMYECVNTDLDFARVRIQITAKIAGFNAEVDYLLQQMDRPLFKSRESRWQTEIMSEVKYKVAKRRKLEQELLNLGI